jgi:hypothetical protein
MYIAEMLHAIQNGRQNLSAIRKHRLPAVTVAGGFGSTAMDPALDSERCGVYHANCTNDAK